MTFEFEQLMECARINVSKAENFEVEHSAAYVNISIAYTLIAIAKELNQMNNDKMPDQEETPSNWPMKLSDLKK